MKTKITAGGPSARLLTVLSSVALMLIGGAGAGLAWWSTTGSGSSATSTAAPLPLVVSAGAPVGALSPGGSVDVAVSVANPNASAAQIFSLALATAQGTGGFAVDAGHAGCSLTALTFSTQTNGGAGWSVPARAGGVDGTLPIMLSGALTMDAGAANACQGAVFTVYLGTS